MPMPSEENKVVQKLSVNEIQNLGFDWPKYALIEEYCVIEDGALDLARSIERIRSSRAYYKRQIDDAFAFKMQTGADYSDFSDRFDDYVRMERQLAEAISYLEMIVERMEK